MTEQTAQTPGRGVATFLYGVVPSDVEPTADAQGVGDPPGKVAVVTHRDIGALISEVPVDRPLGSPEELRAYQRLLDGTAEVAPVLPVRFGAVLADEGAVTDLLARYHDDFRAALNELEGRVEFTVRGRYEQSVVLREVLAENPEVQQLREQVRGQPEEATVALRMRLGELVNQAVEAKRNADTERVVDLLRPLADRVLVRPVTHETDAANVAVLVDAGRRDELEEAVRQLAEEWSERATLRLLGPLAPYDFVGALQPQPEA
jgi:hypothetical protein